MKDPETNEDWQVAVDMANGAIHLLAARAYGLVTGGPAINEARCIKIIERGRAMGIVPSTAAIGNFVSACQMKKENKST